MPSIYDTVSVRERLDKEGGAVRTKQLIAGSIYDLNFVAEVLSRERKPAIPKISPYDTNASAK